VVLLPHLVLLYTFNQYFFQTKSPENIAVLLVLGSFLEVEGEEGGVRRTMSVPGFSGHCRGCVCSSQGAVGFCHVVGEHQPLLQRMGLLPLRTR